MEMKILSNEQKKALFLRLVEERKNEKVEPLNEEGNVFHDAGYYDYGNGWKIKNNGVLGLKYAGLDEEGKNKITLVCGGSIEERGSSIAGLRPEFEDTRFTKSFSDEELDEFLDRFFDMNNMEAINEFSVNNEFLRKNEEYPKNYSNSLEYLNIMDYINEIFGNISFQNQQEARFEGNDNFPLDFIKVAQRYKGIWIKGISNNDEKHPYISFNQNSDTFQYELEEASGEHELLLSIAQKAMSDVPQVYQALREGTYKKEDFVPTIESLRKETPLQQREATLAGLEAEEKTISEAEALIDKQTEKDGQDIGEE